MALGSGFLGANSPLAPRNTGGSQTTTDLQQQAIDAYIPGPNTRNPHTDPAGAYMDAVSGNPNSFGQVGLQQGTMQTPAMNAQLQQQHQVDVQTQAMLNAQQFFQGIYGPQLGILADQDRRLAGQLGFADATFGTQQSILKDQYGIDLSRLGLEKQGIGIEKGAAGRQITNANTLEGLARQLLGNTQRGFDIDLESLTTQERASNQQFAGEKRQAFSSAAARGAMGAPGIGRTTRELSEQLWNRNEGISQDRQRVGLGRERADLGFKREQVGLREQRAAARDRSALLDVRAKGLGLDAKTLQNNLDQGLAKLGVDHFLTSNDLLDAMNSNDLEKRAVAEQIWRSVIENSDFFATLDPAQLQALGITNSRPSAPTAPTKVGRPT